MIHDAASLESFRPGMTGLRQITAAGIASLIPLFVFPAWPAAAIAEHLLRYCWFAPRTPRTQDTARQPSRPSRGVIVIGGGA